MFGGGGCCVGRRRGSDHGLKSVWKGSGRVGGEAGSNAWPRVKRARGCESVWFGGSNGGLGATNGGLGRRRGMLLWGREELLNWRLLAQLQLQLVCIVLLQTAAHFGLFVLHQANITF